MKPVTLLDRYLLPLLIALLTLAAFFPALSSDFVNYDDDLNFQTNENYRGFSSAKLKWMFTNLDGHYIPLTWITFALDYVIWGMDPLGYHLTNVMLHMVNAVLFYFLILMLLPPREGEGRGLRLAAAIGALLFAIHPLRVESVAWITERRDVLSGLFFLLSLMAYFRMHRNNKPGYRWYALSLLFFACSLLSKTLGMMLPFLLLLLDIYPLQRFADRDHRPRAVIRALLEKIPYGILTGMALYLTVLTQAKVGSFSAPPTVSEIILQPGYRFFFYLQKTLLPLDLSPLYMLEVVSAPLNLWALLSGILLICSTFVILWKRKRIPLLATSWMAYGILIFPVLGLMQVGVHFGADRYTYLACLPWAVMIAAILRPLLVRKVVLATAMSVVCGLGILTFLQSQHWKNSETLWNRVLSINPDNAIAYNNRGVYRKDQGNYSAALEDFSKAIWLQPTYSNAYLNRGIVYKEKKMVREEIQEYSIALLHDPGSKKAYFDRGAAYFEKGDRLHVTGRPKEARQAWTQAAEDFTGVLHLEPGHLQSFFWRGFAFEKMGKIPAAIEDYTALLRLSPERPLPRMRRGECYQLLKDYPKAIADYDRAIPNLPDPIPATLNRALALQEIGNFARARQEYLQLLKITDTRWPHRGLVESKLHEIRGKP